MKFYFSTSTYDGVLIDAHGRKSKYSLERGDYGQPTAANEKTEETISEILRKTDSKV